MRKEITNDNDCLYYKLYFNDLYELVDYIKTEPVADLWEGKALKSDNKSSDRYDFTGTHSLEEAIKLCMSPTNINLEYLKNIKYYVEEAKFLSHQRRMKDNYYGGAVSISKYLSGNPMCMKKITRMNQCPTIKIYFNGSYSWKTSKKEVFVRGMCIIIIIKWLELLGYSVDFNFFELSYLSYEISYINVSLKKYGELLDIYNTYFPICNPSFLRRIIFAVQERINYRYNGWCDVYGKFANKEKVNDFLKPDKNSIIISDFSFVYTSSESDIENISKSLDYFFIQYNIGKLLDLKDTENINLLKKIIKKDMR